MLVRGLTVLGASAGFAIEVKGLEKSFGDWPVLWGLDLTVHWGELLVLFGANGVGKTTLLRVLSTQARADAGSLVVAGYDQRRQPEAVRRRVGVVGHQTFLYQDLTCRENLVHYSRLFGLKDYQERVGEVLQRVGLAHRSERRVRTLSNGMQKRLSIARAILHRPGVLLMDEPEAGLDQESVDMLKHLLEEWTQAGRAVVMTTHNVELGLSWAHRAAFMLAGKVHFPEPDGRVTGAEFQQQLAATLGPSQ